MDAARRSWGRTHVNVRCARGANWSLYVPVRIHVDANYVVSVRPLRAGQNVVAGDVGLRRGDPAEIPADVLYGPGQANGETLALSLPADRPLRAARLCDARERDRSELPLVEGACVVPIEASITSVRLLF